MPRKLGDTRLQDRFWILKVPWPAWKRDFVGKPKARERYRAAQDEYYAKTRADEDPLTLDAGSKGRRQRWENLWKERDRIEDLQLVQQGNLIKRLERDSQLEKKKVKRARAKCEQEPMAKFKLIVPSDDLLAVAPPEWQEDQKQALFELRSCCFAVPVGFECTWRLKLDGPSCGLVDGWFNAVQDNRTVKNHHIWLGDVQVTGYSRYRGLSAADHNQKLVTISLSHGVELDAAMEHLPGFLALVKEVEAFARKLTGCSYLKVVRSHLLDQDGKVRFATKAPKQAGFGWHTDKAEEIDEKQGDETTLYRTTSILFTIVARLGGEAVPSAMQVLGFQEAHMDEAGDAQLFCSRLVHCTSVLGGHKVAFFVGFDAPLVAEERFARLQML